MNSEEILLANRGKWIEMMIYDYTSKKKEYIQRTESLTNVNGSYMLMNDHIIMIYKIKDQFYFHSNDLEVCLTRDGISLSFVRRDTMNEFSISEFGNQLYSIVYPSVRFDPINMVDPSFDDDREENQDIHLFIYSLMNDPERQKRIYTVS